MFFANLCQSFPGEWLQLQSSSHHFIELPVHPRDAGVDVSDGLQLCEIRSILKPSGFHFPFFHKRCFFGSTNLLFHVVPTSFNQCADGTGLPGGLSDGIGGHQCFETSVDMDFFLAGARLTLA